MGKHLHRAVFTCRRWVARENGSRSRKKIRVLRSVDSCAIIEPFYTTALCGGRQAELSLIRTALLRYAIVTLEEGGQFRSTKWCVLPAKW
jgi:hypothetical protein